MPVDDLTRPLEMMPILFGIEPRHTCWIEVQPDDTVRVYACSQSEQQQHRPQSERLLLTILPPALPDLCSLARTGRDAEGLPQTDDGQPHLGVEGGGAPFRVLDHSATQQVDNAASWMLASAELLFELMERLLRGLGHAQGGDQLRSFLLGLVSPLDEIHERLHDMVLAAESWEARLTAPIAAKDSSNTTERHGDECPPDL